MKPALLVLNLGSSSLKSAVYFATEHGPELAARAGFDALASSPRMSVQDAAGSALASRAWNAPLAHEAALAALLDWLTPWLGARPLAGVGHRIVHGGARFAAPVVLGPAELSALEALIPLAPLHQPAGLAAVRHLLLTAPALPQVACFDTAFHHDQPQLAQLFALPLHFWDEGVRRYGFHGLSYEAIAHALPALDARAAAGRTVALHLGAGASACAMQAGRSVASSMGFTALDGLMMATRCGNLDPGVILYLMRSRGMDGAALERLLYSDAGLLGVSGLSGDMRVLLASDAPAARLAVDLFCYRAAREVGSLAAALGGIDALVFTGGIGENQPAVRERIGTACAWLGLAFDGAANAAGGPQLAAPGSRVAAWRIETDEEAVIARHTWRLLGAGRA